MVRRAANRVCDAPGCDVPVPRGKLMCRRHWYATPRPLREAINDAWHSGRISEWSELCLEARRFHAQATPRANPVSPQRAYELQARLLGEH